MRYQTKIQYIEAEEWTGSNLEEMKALMGSNYKEINGELYYPSILGKLMKLEIDDFLIKKGNHFMSKEKTDFLKQYEEIKE